MRAMWVNDALAPKGGTYGIADIYSGIHTRGIRSLESALAQASSAAKVTGRAQMVGVIVSNDKRRRSTLNASGGVTRGWIVAEVCPDYGRPQPPRTPDQAQQYPTHDLLIRDAAQAGGGAVLKEDRHGG